MRSLPRSILMTLVMGAACFACDGLLGVDFDDARLGSPDAGANNPPLDGGEDVASACEATCAGCCAQGVCKPGATDDSCGTGGGACAACGNRTCKAGACVSTLLLFGGEVDDENGVTVLPSETWVWDGDTWKQRLVAGPSPRGRLSMTSLGDKVFMGFGLNAKANSDAENDLWSWNGHAWQNVISDPLNPALPGGREQAAMAAFKGKLVLFGGHVNPAIGTGYVDLGDTWEFDGKTWTQRNVTGAPGKRFGAAMAVHGDKLVLHGGSTKSGDTLSDTWEWDGNTWTQKNAIGPVRAFHSMATLGSSIVLFGGHGGLFGDTWLWNGAAWTEWVVSGARPPSRYDAAMATYGNKVVLFGGREGELILGARRRSDTWEWDGITWNERKVSGPAPRSHHAMASVAK